MKTRKITAMIAAIAISIMAAGCASVNSSEVTKTTAASSSSETTVISSDTVSASSAEASDLFTDRDLEQTADTEDAKTITVSDGETIDITEEGVYILSGTASNCTVKVNADSSAKVQLVLDGVSVTNDDFPAIYVISADKVFVTTAEGSTNELSVTGQFTADGDTNTDAVIFSKDDIVLNGLGTLVINSAYGNGISGKDDLKITGGTYSITTAKDAIEANDSISISDGTFTITTNKDGLHCENDDDNTLGSITITGGSFTIKAASDGIQGTTTVQIDGGSFDITSSEGIEATYIVINDGTISIDTSDDGINAASKSTAYSPTVEINGGSLTIVMGQGDTDAIDANGSIYVNGGTINITAPTSSFDYDGTAEFNGGTIIINGEEVSEIPQSMMGGGMSGMGGRGGNRGNRGGMF